jgi:hypothetical protein
MKQGRGDDYIPVTLTSSNSGWHKWWFYLRNDLEFALPSYTGNSIAEELGRWPCQEGAGENPQAALGRVGVPSRSRSHPGGSDRAISRPRSRAASEAAASPLWDDGRQGPPGGDRDRVVAPVVSRGPASRGTGDREINLRVVAVATAPDAPQRGDRKSCELSPSRCILFALAVTSIFSELVFPSQPLRLLAIVVEVRPPRSGHGASPGGGGF